MKTTPMPAVPKMPSVYEQAFDELKRFTPYSPHISLIKAIIYDPPEMNRELSHYERALLRQLATILNSDVRDEADKVLMNFSSSCDPQDRTRLESLHSELVQLHAVTYDGRQTNRLSAETEMWVGQQADALPLRRNPYCERFQELVHKNAGPVGHDLITHELCELSGAQFKDCADAILARLKKLGDCGGTSGDIRHFGNPETDYIARS